MSASNENPVLIVGAGPSGMTAALELTRFGIPVRLIDKIVEPPTTSRAVGVQARTLELFEQRGFAHQLVEAGNPAEAASAYGGGKQIFRLDFSQIDSQYNYLLFVSQAVTEKVLREQLAANGVQTERGVEMIAFAQSNHAPTVTAVLRHPDKSLEQVEASYLLSCEGAHSLARTTMNLEFDGEALDDDYALGDLHVDGELPETDFHIFSSDSGFMGMFPMGNKRWRLIASNPISKPSHDTEPAIEELQKIYDARSPIAARFYDMTWSSWFRINSRMIHKLQEHRVFLSGDAAHIHSPAGAQGMNTGIQDSINLGWKLAMVMRGQASHDLLATYGTDRLPAIRNVLTKTEGLTGAIGSENPVFRTIFNHVAPLVVGREFVQKASTTRMSQIGLNYRESPLSESHAHPGELRAGDRVPDMAVVSGGKPTRLFRLLDPSRLTLLLPHGEAAGRAEMDPSLGTWAALLDVHAISPDAAEAEHFNRVFGDSASLVLVRPDGYVGFLSDARSVEKLAAYLGKWFKTDAAPQAGGPRRGWRV